jgi:hypothetical protein
MIRVRDWGGGGRRGWLLYGHDRRAGPPNSCWGRWALGRAATVPLPLGRARPCCVVGQAGGPCTTRAFGSCRHGHGGSRAVPPMGRAAGPWAVWKSIRAGLTEPVGTGPETVGTGPTGPDRFRFRSVPNWSKCKI